MNLIRCHYPDGSVESFKAEGRGRVMGLSCLSVVRKGLTPVAMTDQDGKLLAEDLDAFGLERSPRWSQAVLDGQRFARNMASARYEARVDLVSRLPESFSLADLDRLDAEAEAIAEERFESKPSAAWPVLAALLVLAVLAGSIASSVAS